jgi:hypothetical protein
MGNFLKLHILNVFLRLALEHTTVEAKVTGSTSRSLQHLLDGNTIHDFKETKPKEHLGESTLKDRGIVGGGGGHTLERLGDGQDTKTTVDTDISEPGHHGNTTVLEFSLTEEVNGGKVREAEGIEADISDVALAVGWGLKEGEGLGLGAQGGDRHCDLQIMKWNEKIWVSI